MAVSILKWVVILAAVVNYGFMAFDGTRALTVGDYIRPSSGEYAGQLGPWSKVVKAVGIPPESNFMKLLFVVYGLAGLSLAVCFALGLEWAWTAMLILSFSSLWYLVPGTALSALQIILLLVIRGIR